jgi:hypothetical protein
MMLNEAMFAGYGGWVLKPAGYRSASPAELQLQAATQGVLDLSIEIFAGQVCDLLIAKISEFINMM